MLETIEFRGYIEYVHLDNDKRKTSFLVVVTSNKYGEIFRLISNHINNKEFKFTIKQNDINIKVIK